MAGVTVKILDLENTVFTETVNLDPATTYVRSVANPATGVNYTFQIVDPAKGVLFTHTENTLNALEANKITLGSQPQPDLSKSDLDQEVLARGLNYEQFMQYGSTESTYRAGLSRFPKSTALLKAAGRLAVSAARFQDAVSELTEVPGDAEAQYYLGYAKQQQGGSPAADFSSASRMALQYLFPNRLSSFAVLRAAIQTNPSDSSAHFLLGLLYMSRRQVENAITEWETTRSLNKNTPTLHRNLGRAYLDIKNDTGTALLILREGLTYDPNNADLQDAYHRAQTNRH